MGENDKQREVFVCQQVADEINKILGSDYQAKRCHSNAPDVRLLSASGVYPTRQAEVVSAPRDFTIRDDNRNIAKFERKLVAELSRMSVQGWLLHVAWTIEVVRYGIKRCDSIIHELAAIIHEHLPDSSPNDCIRLEKPVFRSTPAYHAVDFISAYRVSHPILRVQSCGGHLVPMDGHWINEAICQKSEKYGSTPANWMLVIDGDSYIDPQQISSFRAGYRCQAAPFSEVWVVTVFGTQRLKP